MWKRFNGSSSSFANADYINDNGIYLPNHSKITFDDVDYICEIINEEL